MAEPTTATSTSKSALSSAELFEIANRAVQSADKSHGGAANTTFTTQLGSEPDRYVNVTVSNPAQSFYDGPLGIYVRTWQATVVVSTNQTHCTSEYQIDSLSAFDSEDRNINFSAPLEKGASTLFTKNSETCIEK